MIIMTEDNENKRKLVAKAITLQNIIIITVMCCEIFQNYKSKIKEKDNCCSNYKKEF